MVSKYFELKTNTKEFEDGLLQQIDELKDKKVLLYGAGQGFDELNKRYSITNNMNVVAIADKKFINNTNVTPVNGIKPITPIGILKENYDIILITNECATPISKYLKDKLDIPNDKIRQIFNEDIKDEASNTNYLYKFKFEKTLPKLIKKLKGKSVILYGAGAFLELILKNYDLSGLNILGVSDKRFFHHEENEEWLNYRVFSIEELKDANPDYILVATKFYVNIIEEMYYNTLKNTKIKIKPLLKKDFLTLVKEIWK